MCLHCIVMTYVSYDCYIVTDCLRISKLSLILKSIKIKILNIRTYITVWVIGLSYTFFVRMT